MASQFKNWLILFVALPFVAFGCGDSSSSDSVTVEATGTETGRLAQGYVKNATIIADKIVANGVGNYELDDDEVSTTSDDNGDFELDIPDGYGDYVLYSRGGTVTDSEGNEVPASPMLAPAGSDNITPVTTLVALSPDLADLIGEDYDVDIADEDGVSGDILQLAKSAEAILDAFTDEDSPIITDIEDQIAVLAEFAAELETALNTAIETGTDLDGDGDVDLDDIIQAGDFDDTISDATDTAVTTVVNNTDIVGEGTITDANAIITAVGNAIDQIGDAIDETSDVIEDLILGTVEGIVDDAVQTVDDSSNTVSVEVTTITSKNGEGVTVATLDAENTSVTLAIADAETIETMAFTVSAENEFTETKTYTDTSLLVTLTDDDSLREATVELTNVTVTVTADDVVTLQTSTSTGLVVNGKNIDGELVQAQFDNESVAGDAEIISVDGNVVTVDLGEIEDKIQSELDEDHDLFELSLAGDYTITTSADGVPLASFNGNIDVQ
jgi:hypothetical protein